MGEREALARLQREFAVIVRLLEQTGVEFNRNEDGEIIGLAYSLATGMSGHGEMNVGR